MPQLLTFYLICSIVHSSLCAPIIINLSLNLLRAGCPIIPKHSRVFFLKINSLSYIINIQSSKSEINIGITLPSDPHTSIQISPAGQHCHFFPFQFTILSKISCCVSILISSNQDQFISLSLSFITLKILKSTKLTFCGMAINLGLSDGSRSGSGHSFLAGILQK